MYIGKWHFQILLLKCLIKYVIANTIGIVL